MSSVNLADKDGQTYRPDVFERTEGADTVVVQAVTNVDPATGLPNASTEATLLALKAVADNLLLASQAIEIATEALNTKAVALNTSAIAGAVSVSNFPASVDVVSVDNFPATQTIAGQVSLDAPTLAALETINANTGGLTDAQLRASAISVQGEVALDSVSLSALETITANTGGLTDAQLRANPLPVNVLNTVSVVFDALASGIATDAALGDLYAQLVALNESVHIEDVAHMSGDKGIMMLGIRSDSDAPTASNGDYTTLKLDEEGRVKVASKPASYPDITGDITAIQATISTPVAGGTVSGDVSRASNVMAFCTGTFAGINCTFEGSLEATGDANWFGIQAVRTNANTIETTTGALSAAPAYAWEMSVNGLKRVRVRATARTSGTQSWRFVLGTYATEPIPAAQVSATQPVSGTVTASVGSATFAIAGYVTDVASAAITTTTTTAAITPSNGDSYSVNINVTAVTGTNPTMDVVVQESEDNGTSWFDVYHFPRITATGNYRTPVLNLRGNRLRYVQTISGATPSFTRVVGRLQRQTGADMFRQLISRSIVPTTLNSTTATLNTQGCNDYELQISLGAATTPPAIQLEGSDDNGATWYAIGSPLTGVASSVVKTTITNIFADNIRARVSTAGATVTLNYVLIRGF